ncbi:MAG TPA: hypothetical protein VHE33_10525 [Acidobacteriaceae bacterium]|nr:hypothetical protein [Acidobacteriaceae bacterium]
MEADWSVEIGQDAPVIDVDWPGFVDLQRDPGLIARIAESAGEPALRNALIAFNAAASPVFTSKCDMWELEAHELDPDEFGCGLQDACAAGSASWIDVVARDQQVFSSLQAHEDWVRKATDRLRREQIPCGRVDLVVRAAVAGGRGGFGITLYVAGCGVDTQSAHKARDRVLGAAVAATMKDARASSSIG